jgi:hypothetical protein
MLWFVILYFKWRKSNLNTKFCSIK